MRKILILFLTFFAIASRVNAENSATQMSTHAKELLAKNAFSKSFEEILHAILLDSSDVSIVQQLQTFPFNKLSIDEQLLWHQVTDLIDLRKQLIQKKEALNQKFTIICERAICPSRSAYKSDSDLLNEFDINKETSVSNQLLNNLRNDIDILDKQINHISSGLKFITYPENTSDFDLTSSQQTDPRVSEQAQKVVDLSLKLSESERELTKKILQVQQLTQELEETHSRLELNQKLLETRNTELETRNK